MRVSSPIGELPFEPTRLRISRRGLVVEGVMGAWPAHVRADVSDLASLARLVPPPALAVLGVAALLAVRRLASSPSRPNEHRRKLRV